jgi:hypothetical protein
MLYRYFVKTLIRQSFDHVNNHRWNELLQPVAPPAPSTALAARRENP